MKFVSNLTRKSDRFFAPPSPSGVSAAASALLASFVKEAVYKANVEHVTISLENAYYYDYARANSQNGISFTQMESLTYIQQFRTGKHTFLHAGVEKVDVIAQQLVDRDHF